MNDVGKLSRPPEDKVTTLESAIKKFVSDGCYLCWGGFADRSSVAAVFEIARQGITDLQIVTDTDVSIQSSFLMGLGLVRKYEFAYCWGAIWGPDPLFRRAAEKGIPRKVELEEYSNYSAGLRFMAGSLGLSHLPTKSLLGSDIPKYNKRIKIVDDPYTGEPSALVPAACPDVSIIHVQRSDALGNAQIMGYVSNDEAIARASQRVIITCEEIVPTSEVKRLPNLTYIPYYCVDAVVEVPFGSHPRGVPYYYYHDVPFGLNLPELWKTEDGFKRWVDEWVFDTKDWNGYCEKVGWDRLNALARIERKFQVYGEAR
jgi:glutaconate CoA-transferase subunit A